MRHVALGLSVLLLAGCSSIVNDSHVPMTLSFSDNSAGECSLKNLHICPVASQTAFKQIKQIYKRSDKKTTDPLFPFF